MNNTIDKLSRRDKKASAKITREALKELDAIIQRASTPGPDPPT